MKCTPLVIVASTVVCLWAQTPADPDDSTLVAYWLTPEQEALFSQTDRMLSAFWEEWAGRDSVHMMPWTHCCAGQCTFESFSDAQVVVKAAGGRMGLYLCAAVTDDRWYPTSSFPRGPGDFLALYVDKMAPDDIWTCTDCLIGLYTTKFTYGTRIIELWHDSLGGILDSMTYRSYDDVLWCGLCDMQFSLLRADTCHMVKVDWTTDGAGHNAVEILFPWVNLDVNSVGPCWEDGFPLGTVPGRTSRYSLSVSYTDMDAEGDSLAALAWLGNTPWHGDRNYWGSLEFGPGFPLEPTPAESLAVASVARSSRPRRGLLRYTTGRWYDLKGRLLSAGVAAPGKGVTLRALPRHGVALQLDLTNR